MRTTFKFLSLLLCIELIIGPFQTQFSLIGQKAFAQTSCAAGMSFDSTLNRCLTTAETANVMNATASCAQGDVECYKTNAQNAFQDKVNKGDAPERKENSPFLSTVTQVGAIAGPITLATMGLASSKSPCTSASFWTMVGGSVALFVGDNLANFLHKKRLQKIKEEWGKIVNPEQANGDQDKIRQANTESQSQAFEMLARSEDSLVSAAKMKRNLFTVAALAYGASAIIATLETGSLLGNVTTLCAPEPSGAVEELIIYNDSLNKFKDNSRIISQLEYNLNNSKDLESLLINKQAFNQKYTSPSIDDYLKIKKALEAHQISETNFNLFKKYTLSFLKELSPLKVAHAEGSTVQTNAAKAYKEDSAKSSNIFLTAGFSVAAILLAKKFIQPQTVTPTQRAILSGSLAAMSTIMASHAASQADASQRRADLLRKMRDDFVSASGALNACKSEDRNDPSKPNCYCYTPDNQRNTNRNASSVCQKLWTGISNGTSLASSDPSATSDKICVTNKNQADPSCSCKTNNTCMKITTGNLSGLSASTATLLNSAIAPLNSLTTGAASAANLDSSKLGNQAMQMQSALKQLATNKATKDLIPNKDQQEAKLTADLNKASAGLGSGNMLGASSSSAMPSNPGQAAVMLEKELNGSKSSSEEVISSGTINAPASNNKTEQLEFGLTTEQAAAQETQIAEVMKKDLDYGGNDINQGSKTNIFEVLSNRYQRSGMRRLFDEKGTTQAEKPAQTDINQ